MTADISFHHLKSGKLQIGQVNAMRKRRLSGPDLEGSVEEHMAHRLNEATERQYSGKSSHWSIAWSDLMMTMFILFLSLFVYQAAHKDFLVSGKAEVAGGDTREAVQVAEPDEAAFPFVAIKPAAPLITAGTIRKVERVTIDDVGLDRILASLEVEKTLAELASEPVVIAAPAAKNAMESRRQTPVAHSPALQKEKPRPLPETPPAPFRPENRRQKRPSPVEEDEQPVDIASLKDTVQPLPLMMDDNAEKSVNELFSHSRKELDTYNLEDFASIDLVPDKAVRIVLAGDLLFDIGEASLSGPAIASLEKIASIISTTHHRIHIEGHTDDLPIAAGRYANNWELSMARAKAVAVFLIEDMGMDPDQFVISGYSSYQPVVPNTSPENRAANRRVEIVVAQNPEHPELATLDYSAPFYRKL